MLAIKDTIIMLIMVLVLFIPNLAYSISITDNRLILDENNRSQIITIRNNTDKTLEYKVKLVHYSMSNTMGRLKKIPLARKIKNVNWADNIIELSENNFTIPPKASKDIIISIKKNTKVENNKEYRSHIWIKTIIDKKANDFFSADAETGIVKPIFVRYGEFNADVKLNNLKIKKLNDIYEANFTVLRNGNRSIYGSVKISCINNNDRYLIKEIHGLAVYTELEQKTVRLNFDLKQKNCKNIEVAYVPLVTDKLFNGTDMARLTTEFKLD